MARQRTDTLRIRTPEGVVFSLLVAGPVTRSLAWMIDFLVLFVASYVIYVVLAVVSIISVGLVGAVQVILFFLLQIGYGIGCEWLWRGQTIGKKLFRLRVVDAQGLRLQFSQVVVRNLLRVADAMPVCYLVGGLATLISEKGQRLGDLAANTIVVRNPQPKQPDLDQLMVGKFNSLRAHPHLAARLRQRVEPHEATVALQALLRRDEMEAGSRVELFAELANYFREAVEFPPESVEGISDENYIRNVVDILFRQRAESAPANALSA